jgi:hypothetical protein
MVYFLRKEPKGIRSLRPGYYFLFDFSRHCPNKRSVLLGLFLRFGQGKATSRLRHPSDRNAIGVRVEGRPLIAEQSLWGHGLLISRRFGRAHAPNASGFINTNVINKVTSPLPNPPPLRGRGGWG